MERSLGGDKQVLSKTNILDRAVRMALVASFVLGPLLVLKNLQGNVVSADSISLTEAPSMPSSLDFTPVLIAKDSSFLEVRASCFDPSGSRDLTDLPVIDINASVPATPDKYSWLTVTQEGTRNFRVLTGSEKGKGLYSSRRYYGSADPDDKYTDYPVGKFVFKTGRNYIAEIDPGDLSSRRTPLLDYKPPFVLKKEFQVPQCRGNR